MVNFVTPALMRQKYAVGVNNGKVSLSLRRIKKVLGVKYQEGENVESVANGNDPYLVRQEKNMKKYIQSH